MNQSEFNETIEDLTPKQKRVLKLFLSGKQDYEIAQGLNCSESNVRHHIAKICTRFGLRETEGDRCRPDLIELFIDCRSDWVSTDLIDQYRVHDLPQSEFPGRPLPLNSPFYVKPPGVLERCYREIVKPGALIRVRASRKMGKTSLLNRLLYYANQKGYRTVSFNFRDVDAPLLEDLDQFLRCFSANISHKLGLEPQLDAYWDPRTGSMPSCTTYFQAYVLERLDAPLVIALDEVDWLFGYPKVHNFFTLLRKWYEEGRNLAIWENVRLVVVYSTAAYVNLDINHSPFNVGEPVNLPILTVEQVRGLAHTYGLRELGDRPIHQLLNLVGGHPYLIQLALYHLSRDRPDVDQLLADAPTPAGIYRNHLQMLWEGLQVTSDMIAHSSTTDVLSALQHLIQAEGSMRLPQEAGFKLEGMGLVRFEGNQVKISCNLYRQYFWTRMGLD
jgi:DNA-binding CsgD family transcriptional regulator